MIYENITTTQLISTVTPRSPRGRNPWLVRDELNHTILLNLLLVSRQISTEYFDHIIPGSQLHLNLWEADRLPEDLALKPTFSPALLRRVNECLVFLPWWHLEHGPDWPKASEWCHEHSMDDIEHREALPWTPTKGMTGMNQSPTSRKKLTRCRTYRSHQIHARNSSTQNLPARQSKHTHRSR